MKMSQGIKVVFVRGCIQLHIAPNSMPSIELASSLHKHYEGSDQSTCSIVAACPSSAYETFSLRRSFGGGG